MGQTSCAAPLRFEFAECADCGRALWHLGLELLREVLALDEDVLRALHHVGVREDEVLVVVETEFLAAHLLWVWVVLLMRFCLGSV